MNEKRSLLREDLLKNDQVILSGAICGWGDSFKSYFDLVIFLWLPENIRIERLQQREFQRYGQDIVVGGSKYEQSKAFIEWASLYDKAGMEVRRKTLHEHWMSDLTCPVLRIEGDFTVGERNNIVLNYLGEKGSNQY